MGKPELLIEKAVLATGKSDFNSTEIDGGPVSKEKQSQREKKA
jgi:hypothetical protein